MAVKQNVVEGITSSAEARLQIILRFLQEIPKQEGLKDKMCSQIVQSLGTLQVPSKPESYLQFISDIQSIQNMLAKECSNKHLIFATLEAFYKEISDPEKNPSPAMSIVLQLISPENIPNAVKWILQPNYSEQGLEQALFTLCLWLSKWTWTENLGPLVLALIQGLENEQNYDILVEVTVSTIEQLFKLLILPEPRKNVGPVVLCMLSKLQDRPDAFHKIIPHVGKVISCLHKEKSDNANFYIQSIVNLCLGLMDIFPGYTQLYDSLKTVLKPYYGSSDYKQILNCPSWSYRSNVVREPHHGRIGLNNLGNTCYMNSVLQALFMTKIFRNEVLLKANQETSLFLKLQELFVLLQFSHKPSLSPSNILNLARPPGFIQGQQHDSSEFLGYLLDILHEQEKTNIPVEAQATSQNQLDTTVQESFGGRTATVFRCGDCGTSSERIDNFRELQLSFPNNVENQSVQTLLEYYLQPEILHGDNQYQCDVCQHLVDGERLTKITEAPRRLILTLKYFCYDPVSQQRTKLSSKVKLNDYISLDAMHYELYAVVVHSGCSVDSGHYYTFAKDNEDWYRFNDSSVSKTSPDELCRLIPPVTPYILFYRRQDSSDPVTLDKSSLSPRLQLYLSKENSDFTSERFPVKSNNYNQFNDEDDPPPPNCGGNSFSSSNSNMFVC